MINQVESTNEKQQPAGAEGGHLFAKPGELRKEYLELLRQEEEKARLEREKEELESMELIRRLVVSFILFLP